VEPSAGARLALFFMCLFLAFLLGLYVGSLIRWERVRGEPRPFQLAMWASLLLAVALAAILARRL
jgi:hypothetical protein